MMVTGAKDDCHHLTLQQGCRLLNFDDRSEISCKHVIRRVIATKLKKFITVKA